MNSYQSPCKASASPLHASGESPLPIFFANIKAAKSSPASTTDAKESSHPYSIISLNRTYCHWL